MKKCNCGELARLNLEGKNFCYRCGRSYLNNKIRAWRVEYDNPNTGHYRKVLLWQQYILPTMQFLDTIPR